nr:MBL fold metallo-hydrolase [uncultured Sphingomonas sp.]
MRRLAIFPTAIALTLVAGPVSAVSPAAVTAQGASRPISSFQHLCRPVRDGIAIDLRGIRYAQGQARDPRQDVAEVDVRQSMILLPRGRFLLRTSSLDDRGVEFRLRTAGFPEGEKTIDEIGWRHGDALLSDNAAASAQDYADLMLLAPAFLACKAGGAVDDGSGRMRVSDGAGRTISVRWAGETDDIAEASLDGAVYRYEDWRTVGGVRQPGRITVSYNGKVGIRWTAVAARPQRAGDDRLMVIPAAYAPAPDRGPLRAEPLGGGAFTTEGGTNDYHTGFVVGDRAIAVFDAPISPDAAKAVRRVIERTAPGKPIAYAVVSHAHGDHIAGLAAYADAEIITGPGGWNAIGRSLGAAAPSRHREIVKPAVLDLGGRSLRLYPFDSVHSKTMIVAFAPESGAIFQGDLFYRPERMPMLPIFETGGELDRIIAGERLDVKTIVGVHGRRATMQDLREALSLRPGHNDRGCIGFALTSALPC